MVESMVGLYALICWLLFVKFKLVPVTTYTVCTAIFVGAAGMGLLFLSMSIFHPQSNDGRLYAPVVQIVPQVRGTVIEVPVEANKPMKKGDVLFRIDPRPYQIEVDRLRASLETRNVKFAQLEKDLAAAEAASRQARANLQVSESKDDRQLRETYESAKSQVEQIAARKKLAEEQFKRADDLMKSGAGSQQDWDRARANLDSATNEYEQAQSAERNAKNELTRGSASLEATRQALYQAQEKEESIRKAFNAQIDGQNPEVRETAMLLEKARWDLDQTTVRAPTDGYVPQQLLRPGMMAVPIPLKPMMMYVVEERPVLVASYPQRVLSDIKPGMHGEAVFKHYPGRTFKVKVRRVMSAISEGELNASGNIETVTSENAPGHVPIVFDYDEDIANLNMPVGSQASIAIYTDRVHALSLLRKIILRIHSWENYLF